jgi:hypothetical protein
LFLLGFRLVVVLWFRLAMVRLLVELSECLFGVVLEWLVLELV